MSDHRLLLLLVVYAILALVVVLATKRNEREETTTTTLSRRRLRVFDPSAVVKQPPNPDPSNRSLDLIHITSTGATYLEKAAWKDSKMIWGVCHGNTWPHIGCDKPDWDATSIQWMGSQDDGLKYSGEFWHCPAQWLHPNPYEDKDTFVVIRNPYDRVVHEYHNMAGAVHAVSSDHREMNDWIQLKLREIIKLTHYPGHFLPQHFYVYDKHGKQVVNHVLRFEELHQGFSDLMELYKLKIRLPKTLESEKENRFFTKDFLSQESIAMINTLYAHDFVTFGYRMVTRPGEFAAAKQPESGATSG